MYDMIKLGMSNFVTSFAEVWIEIKRAGRVRCSFQVTSFAEVWIEITTRMAGYQEITVTSFAEVWIEIHIIDESKIPDESLPSRKCGLKYPQI